MTQNKKNKDSFLTKNRKAFHDFHILETYEAGLELKGTEVKSCRAGSISLADSYARVDKGEAFLFNVHIAPYEHGNRFNHDPLRPRRLLLHKREILKMVSLVREKGNSIVPLKFYLKRGKVKVELGIAKGKTHFDKRDTLRKRQDDLESRRIMASRR